MKPERKNKYAPFHPDVKSYETGNSDPSDIDHGYARRNEIHAAEFRRAVNRYLELSDSRDAKLRTFAKPRYPVRPMTGEMNILIVPFEFENKRLKKSQEHFKELFFSEGKMQNGSVKEYFREVSGGKVEICGKVTEPVEIPFRGPNFPTLMVKDALAKLPSSIDLSTYINSDDRDRYGRKIIDGLIFVHRGRGQEVSGLASDVHAQEAAMSPKVEVDCGEYTAVIQSYVIIPEESSIGICCHELGHLLFKLPDLYDKDNDSGAVGRWCLMGKGCWNPQQGKIPAHPSAHCKAYLGWVDVEVLNGEGHVTLDDIKKGNKIMQIWGLEENKFEWFLLEYRNPIRGTYDEAIPGGGLLIWHIDMSEDAKQWKNNRRRVSLEQADGKFHLSKPFHSSKLKDNYGDKGDPFPGKENNTKFTEKTCPNSNSNEKIDSNVQITNIKLGLNDVQFKFSNK